MERILLMLTILVFLILIILIGIMIIVGLEIINNKKRLKEKPNLPFGNEHLLSQRIVKEQLPVEKLKFIDVTQASHILLIIKNNLFKEEEALNKLSNELQKFFNKPVKVIYRDDFELQFIGGLE